MTRLGRSLVVTGDVTSDEDVTIDGEVHGHVSVQGATITIGEHARIDAAVRGARVVVQGAVTGAISATERIELTASANVTGTLSADHVVIADGALFAGRVDMDQRTIAQKVARFRADHAAGR